MPGGSSSDCWMRGSSSGIPWRGEVSLVELEVQGLERYGALAAVRTLLHRATGRQRGPSARASPAASPSWRWRCPGSALTRAWSLHSSSADLGPPELLIRSLEADPDRARVGRHVAPAAKDEAGGAPAVGSPIWQRRYESAPGRPGVEWLRRN